MSFKVALVQILTLALLLTAVYVAFILISDDQINVSVINKTESEITHPALSLGNQHCSTTALAPNDYLICSFAEGEENEVAFIGRVNEKTYKIGEIKGIVSGMSYRNIIELKPNAEYNLSTKQVIG